MKVRGLLKHRHDIEELRWLVDWLTTGETGLSSKALATWAVLGEPRLGQWLGNRWWEPSDNDDLRRCELMFASAPPRVQGRMEPKMIEWRAHVAENHKRWEEKRWTSR